MDRIANPFAKVPKATLNALAKNPAALKRVLLYHVVAGKVPAAKVVTCCSTPFSRTRKSCCARPSTGFPAASVTVRTRGRR